MFNEIAVRIILLDGTGSHRSCQAIRPPRSRGGRCFLCHKCGVQL